jgi:ankyrin repeat protein
MAKVKKRFNRVAARYHSIPPDEGMQFLDAVHENDITMAEAFIDKYGVDILEVRPRDWIDPKITSLESDSFTPLMQAVSKSHFDMAEMLIKRGANVNATMDEGFTPLMLGSNNAPMATLLLDNGAELEAAGRTGNTALMWPHTPAALKFFIDRKANVHARNIHGKTALMLVAWDNYVHKDAPPSEHINILLDAGSEIDAQDNNGRTALMDAAFRSAYDDDALLKVSTLLQRGANPDIRDKEGNTAAALAKRPRPDLDAQEDQQKAVAELLDRESEKRAENLRRHIVEGGDSSIVIYKPLQLNLRKL